MAVRMVALKRTQRGLWTARKAIPADVREAYGKREEKRTWPATLGLSEAKSAYATWLAGIESRIENFRKQASGETVTLTHRETLALAGSWYAAAVARHENAPGDRLGWQLSLDDLEPEDTPVTYRAYERGAFDPDEPVRWRRQPFLVADVDELLLSRGLVADATSREALIEQVHEAHRDLCRLMLRRCDGDYGPDSAAARFPAADNAAAPGVPGTHHQSAARAPARTRAKVPLFDLFDGYVAERQPAPATQKAFRRQLEHLVAFLGHDDAARMTADDLVNWKDDLLAPQPDGTRRAARTVKDTYLAAARAVFAWGVDNRRLDSNPAAGVRVRAPKKPRLRDPGFSETEALTILKATLGPSSEQISPEHARARRWVPWLCAYTGARVNEMTQLRAEDVLEEDGVWVLRITPEAGSVKTHEARIVPIHSHLIDQGFLNVVGEIGSGPLFYDPRRGRGGSAQNPHSKKTGERLAAWVRSIGVADPEVQPNHAWRHRFKTVGREAGMDPEARDRIQGHAPRSEGQAYGVWSAKALKTQIERLPRIEVRP
jgi:integrase